jgi:outer membrane lipoprotein-sorting protein
MPPSARRLPLAPSCLLFALLLAPQLAPRLAALRADTKPLTLDSVLSEMDAAAASFQSLTARIHTVKHTAIVNADDVDDGTLWVKRIKNHASRVLIEFTSPNTYYVYVGEKKAEIYRPKIATIEEWDVTKFRKMRDQVWLLSFGTAGRDLRAHYDIRLAGEETAAGTPAVKLELVPKSSDTRQQIPRIEMWISTRNWQPVQQKFYDVTPGDYRLAIYTGLKVNAPITESQLRLHAPPGTKRIQPQK